MSRTPSPTYEVIYWVDTAWARGGPFTFYRTKTKATAESMLAEIKTSPAVTHAEIIEVS